MADWLAVSVSILAVLATFVAIWNTRRTANVMRQVRLSTEVLNSELAKEALTPNPIRNRDSVHYEYHVGLTPTADLLIQTHRVSVIQGQSIPYWLTYVFFDDPNVAKLTTLDDFKVSEGLTGAVPLLLPSEREPRRLNIALVFEEPVLGDSEWEFRLNVPGFWDPLRKTGSDKIFIDVENERFDEITLSIQSPDQSWNISAEPTETPPDEGHTEIGIPQALTDQTLPTLSWSIARPNIGRYALAVHLSRPEVPVETSSSQP